MFQHPSDKSLGRNNLATFCNVGWRFLPGDSRSLLENILSRLEVIEKSEKTKTKNIAVKNLLVSRLKKAEDRLTSAELQLKEEKDNNAALRLQILTINEEKDKS